MHIGPSEGLLVCWMSLLGLFLFFFLEGGKKEVDIRYDMIGMKSSSTIRAIRYD